MRDLGYDLGKHRSKGLSELPDVEFDAAVTMGCGDEWLWKMAQVPAYTEMAGAAA